MGLAIAQPHPSPEAWSTVQTDGGPVTLATIDGLRARVAQLNVWLTQAGTSSMALHSEADDQYASAGAMLVPRRKEWTVPGAINGQVDRATALAGSIADNDKTIAELKDSESHANVFGRIGAWRHDREIARARVAEGTELRSLLIQIAKSSPPSTIPEAEAGIRAATDLEEQAATLDQQIETTRRSVTGLDDELTRRGDSLRSMGFDALYEAAVLQTSGPTAVDSPLLLKAGEVAYLSVPAALSRMVTRTRYVGGSSGFSFPIGHTGIRYRVGTYRGHPVQRQALTNLDTGTLVVSTQRVAFIGRTKSTSIPLGKILHVEVYSDAVAVFQERRENPDFYMMSQPQHAVFLLNWVLGQTQRLPN